MAHASLTRWFPFLAWPRPSRALLRGEFWAGITVGLMLVPQGVAYAQLAGMPLVTGIGGVTFALTLATAPRLYWGVLAGLVMNLSHFLYQRLHPRIIEVGLHPDGSLRDRRLWQLPPLAPRLLALRMDAALDFASASSLERHVAEHLAAHPEVRQLCLFAQPINRIDVTGVEMFARLRGLLRTRAGTLHVSGLKLPVQQTLERAGALAPGPDLALYRADVQALAALQAGAEPETPAQGC